MRDKRYNPIEAVGLFETNAWGKSTFSKDGDECLEFAKGPDDSVGLRDSKQPDAAAFIFTKAEIAAFISGAKAGEFDHLVS